MKVTGLELISEMVAERELQKKKERDVRKDRINQLIAQEFNCSQSAIQKALKRLKITRKKRLPHTKSRIMTK